MRKLTTILMASVFAMSVTATARADDTLIRLGVGIGAAFIGEGIKALNNRKATPQRSTPASKNSSSGSRSSASQPRAVASKPARVPDENVRFVQQKLSDLGYTEVGGADGFWGSNSAKALAIFMKDNGIEGEPKASPEIIAALAKAKTRQQIADAKESAVAEANMPATKVEDGIVHFGPKPGETADADAEHIATEHAIEPEDFSDEALTPAADTQTATETVTPPLEEKTASIPKEEPVPETTATAEPKREAATADVAVTEKAPPTEKTVVAEIPAPAPEEAVVEKAENGSSKEINGLSISGDF